MNMAPINPPGKQAKDLEQQTTNGVTHKHNESDKSDIFIRQVVMMTLWYIFSFGTMFTNKYILTDLNGDAGILGETQMFCSAVFGAFKMYLPCCLFQRSHHEAPRFHFFRNMAILGFMR
jgi:solute carrier family 35 protein E2